MALYYMMVNMAVLLTGGNVGISVLVGVAGVTIKWPRWLVNYLVQPPVMIIPHTVLFNLSYIYVQHNSITISILVATKFYSFNSERNSDYITTNNSRCVLQLEMLSTYQMITYYNRDVRYKTFRDV